jgi:prepilin-type N-terminal cleavage/methylation domain-containing protein
MKGERGYTLIEILLAIGLISVFALSVPSALSGTSKATMTAKQHITAESLARSQVDYIQNQPYDSVNATPVYAVIPDVPASYSIVTPMATRLDPRGDGTANDDGLQKITVTVKQNDKIMFTLIDIKVNYNP